MSNPSAQTPFSFKTLQTPAKLQHVGGDLKEKFVNGHRPAFTYSIPFLASAVQI